MGFFFLHFPLDCHVNPIMLPGCVAILVKNPSQGMEFWEECKVTTLADFGEGSS